MTDKNNENLNELLAGFLDANAATKMAEDIIAGDNIFDSNPAPLPSRSLLADIKQNMFNAAQKNRRRSYRFIWQYAAAAAVIIIVFGAGITLLHKPAQYIQSYESDSFWQDTFTTLENTIDTQLAQLLLSEPDVPVVTLEAKSSPEMAAITEMASELDDINATFWEG